VIAALAVAAHWHGQCYYSEDGRESHLVCVFSVVAPEHENILVVLPDIDESQLEAHEIPIRSPRDLTPSSTPFLEEVCVAK